jgi:hypothetical protein
VLHGGNIGQKVLLVVREGMVEKVKEYFQINEVKMVYNTSML